MLLPIQQRLTATRNVVGEDNAAKVASALVHRSSWFVVTPLPDDLFAVTFKAGEGLEQLLDALGVYNKHGN
jgi:hypothetical protein